MTSDRNQNNNLNQQLHAPGDSKQSLWTYYEENEEKENASVDDVWGSCEPGKKRMLIYAHYYVPDVASTGQILKDLAEGLQDDLDVTVICTVPSYTGKVKPRYTTQRYYREVIGGVKILRIRVPEYQKTSKGSRILNLLSYFLGALAATFKVGKMDYIFAISQPPIMGGMLGVWGKAINRLRGRKTKFIYNIQDFNPEQSIAVKYIYYKRATGLMLAVDKFSCRRSDLVVTVGRDLKETMHRRFPHHMPKTIIINNWVDEKAIFPLSLDHPTIASFRHRFGLENKFIFMYSGNLGLYYDLEALLHVIKRFRKGRTHKGVYEKGPRTPDGKEVVFVFVGEGSVREQMARYSVEHHFENVFFLPYQDKDDLIYSLNAANVHWCVNARGIKGVSCPSKAYGIMAVGKPILGVLEEGSEVRCLIEETQCGHCCEPGDYEAIAGEIQWFIDHGDSQKLQEMGERGRRYLENNLTREISIKKYKDAIHDLD